MELQNWSSSLRDICNNTSSTGLMYTKKIQDGGTVWIIFEVLRLKWDSRLFIGNAATIFRAHCHLIGKPSFGGPSRWVSIK